MISEVPYDVKGQRCIVKIQQDHQGIQMTNQKPRITAYSLPPRPSSPPFPPPPPLALHDATPSPSPSFPQRTQPKRTITSPASVSVIKNDKLTTHSPHSFSPIRRSVNEFHGINNRPSERNQKPDKERDKTFSKKLGFSKPRNVFSSQLYLMFHLSVTICLLRYRGFEMRSFISYEDVIFTYFAYLLATSILFLILLRCWGSDNIEYGGKEIHTEHTVILFGSISLGIIQLIKHGLDIAQCIDNELVFLPVMQFIFAFFLMHFILTQVANGKQQGFSNIALAHLLSTQISLWLINLDSNFEACSFNKEMNRTIHMSTKVRTMLLPSSVANLLMPIIHHYQLLTAFIIITIWFTNNQPKINFIRAKISDEEASRSITSKRSTSIKGFFMGLLMLLTAIIVLLLEDELLKIVTHISIQGLTAICVSIGLIIRGKEKYNYYKNHMSTLDCQLIIYATLFAAYICGISTILHNTTSKSVNWGIFIDGIMLIVQFTLQTFLVKAQETKFVNMRQIFAFLILTNISIWILEVSEISITMAKVTGVINLATFLSLIVALNRFYSSLVFIEFWRSK